MWSTKFVPSQIIKIVGDAKRLIGDALRTAPASRKAARDSDEDSDEDEDGFKKLVAEDIIVETPDGDSCEFIYNYIQTKYITIYHT